MPPLRLLPPVEVFGETFGDQKRRVVAPVDPPDQQVHELVAQAGLRPPVDDLLFEHDEGVGGVGLQTAEQGLVGIIVEMDLEILRQFVFTTEGLNEDCVLPLESIHRRLDVGLRRIMKDDLGGRPRPPAGEFLLQQNLGGQFLDLTQLRHGQSRQPACLGEPAKRGLVVAELVVDQTQHDECPGQDRRGDGTLEGLIEDRIRLHVVAFLEQDHAQRVVRRGARLPFRPLRGQRLRLRHPAFPDQLDDLVAEAVVRPRLLGHAGGGENRHQHSDPDQSHHAAPP